MNPLNPVNPTIPSPRVRRPEEKVNRREPGTGGNLQKQDNSGRKPRKPSGGHNVDELA
jgi:hypothetical protein